MPSTAPPNISIQQALVRYAASYRQFGHQVIRMKIHQEARHAPTSWLVQRTDWQTGMHPRMRVPTAGGCTERSNEKMVRVLSVVIAAIGVIRDHHRCRIFERLNDLPSQENTHMTIFFTHRTHAYRWLALALFVFLPGVACAQVVTGVGFHAITIQDPVNGGTMPGYVFYPSAKTGTTTWRGPYELHATADAPPIPGAKPLVVISHGHGGSDLGHHDLAVHLASHGIVVATLQHPKDNFLDDSGDGQPEVMIGRPIQVKATISMLLDDPHWKNLIDPQRIGVAGFSNGGYTTLLLVGAVPQFTRFIGYCKAHPDDPNICGKVKQIVAQLAKQGLTARQMLTAMQDELRRWGNTDDPRVRAAFAMAPQSLVFDKAGIASINRPVFLYYGQDDEVLRPKYNVLHIAPLIKTLAGIKMIPKAGHYVFLAPCSSQLLREAPGICRDPAGIDRVKAHVRINADALAFFRKTLASPSH